MSDQTTKPTELLYGLEHQETLDLKPSDVLEEVFKNYCERTGEPWGAIADRVPWPINIRVFKRMTVDVQWLARCVLDYTLETLDEEHSDPDGSGTDRTDKMREAAKVFAEAIVSEYTVWNCEPTGETISITREQAGAEMGENGL